MGLIEPGCRSHKGRAAPLAVGAQKDHLVFPGLRVQRPPIQPQVGLPAEVRPRGRLALEQLVALPANDQARLCSPASVWAGRETPGAGTSRSIAASRPAAETGLVRKPSMRAA